MKIMYNRNKCIGCGICASLCPKFWKMEKDGKSVLLGSQKKENTEEFELKVENVKCNKEAAQNCPVQAIKIEKGD